jgi:histidinol-phosphatase (PHP family)
MAAMCEAAIARGIREVAFTDHVDFGPADPPGYFRPSEYLADIKMCRARYGDRLTIRSGAELGDPHLFSKQAQAALDMGEFDFVIGSAHYAEGLQVAWEASFFEQPLRQAYEAYFRQVAHLAAEGEFDVLGHLDLVKRDAHKFGKSYDGPGPYAGLIRAALRSVVERGKGIEINTSALYKGYPEPCPSLEILCWYRDLGGEILTIGSDAHIPDHVGSCFEVALEMARATGFTRLARFEQRQILWQRI